MIKESHPYLNTLLGTLFTWLVTALGAGLVYVIPKKSNTKFIMSFSLSFAGGVMLAASYFSLLAPSVELSKASRYWNPSIEEGSDSVWIVVPVCSGFLLGAAFVAISDKLLENLGIHGDFAMQLAVASGKSSKDPEMLNDDQGSSLKLRTPWRRILLLIVAVTVHNIPEGMAVGIAFAAVGRSPHATFQRARSLTLGIGLQNFPEGLAVSLPLLSLGFSPSKSFYYGQLSGMVEPAAGFIGALAVNLFEPLLPWSLSFAAGAMVYVVLAEVVLESHAQTSNLTVTNWAAMFGFALMMCLDVGSG